MQEWQKDVLDYLAEARASLKSAGRAMLEVEWAFLFTDEKWAGGLPAEPAAGEAVDVEGAMRAINNLEEGKRRQSERKGGTK